MRTVPGWLQRGPLIAACLLSAATSCGGDDDTEATPTTLTSGKGGGGGGGSTATGGRSGSSSTTTTPPPAPVECGANKCQPPANPFALLGGFNLGGTGLPTPLACCLDEEKGTCGTKPMESAACEAPAVADSRCPSISLGGAGGLPGGIPGGAQMNLGCCIDNKCGLNAGFLGRGCVENSEAKTMLAAIPLIGGFINVPASQACDAKPATESDAGVAEDAGL